MAQTGKNDSFRRTLDMMECLVSNILSNPLMSRTEAHDIPGANLDFSSMRQSDKWRGCTGQLIGGTPFACVVTLASNK
jgi:hypothetical protein